MMFWLSAALGLGLAAVALWVQLPRLGGLGAGGLWLLVLGGLFWLRGQSPALGWGALAAVFAAATLWYSLLSPRADRIWAFDVARIVTARIDGTQVHLRNIRDFNWTSPDQAEPRWTERVIDLDQISSVEMLTSVWSSAHIAHLLVSFGIEGEEPVVFSAEIRREEGEAFSTIGGFFRQFELALIAATERDIVQLRSHIRHESVARYEVDLTPAQRRELFLAYIGLAQRLEARPEFYNTITANCTSVVWGLARMLDPSLRPDISLVLPGHLPAYLERLGYLGGVGDLAAKRAAAQLSPQRIDQHRAAGMSFSQAIRRP